MKSATALPRHRVLKSMLAGASLFAIAATATEAVAQAAEPSRDAVEEVVVTANRRGAQSVIDVPQAVNAYSGETLQNYGVKALEDLGKIDPAVNIQRSSATQQRIIIRGVYSNTTQTAGLYLDEVPLLGGFVGNIAGDGSPGVRLHDLGSVEIAKGPQGTLFGAGSMSGTVRATTAAPRLSGYEGRVAGNIANVAGGNNYYDANFAASMPIVEDVLGLRLVGWTEQGGGYIDKVIPLGGRVRNDANDRDLFGGRAGALWQVNDRLSLQFNGLYQRSVVDGPESITARVGVEGLGLAPRPEGFGRNLNYTWTEQNQTDQYKLFSVVANYDLGFGRVIVSGSRGEKYFRSTSDTTGQACNFGLCPPRSRPSAFVSDQVYRVYTQEARFVSKFGGRLEFVAGVYAQQDKRRFYGSVMQSDPITGQPLCDDYFDCRDRGLIRASIGNGPPTNSYLIYITSNLGKTEQFAAYAQADYKILDNLTLTVGGRYYTADILDLEGTVFFPRDNFRPFESNRNEATQKKPTYNVALLWEVNPDLSLYTRVASGFRIGGINQSAETAAAEGVIIPNAYAPDYLTNYEIGSKLYLLDRRVFLDAALYHIDWRDQQLSGVAAATYDYQLNAGRTKTYGAELSGTANLLDGLSLSGSITWTRARLAEDLPMDVQLNGTPGLSGDRLPFVPRWSYALRGEYQYPVSDNLLGYLQGNLAYRASVKSTFRQVTPAQIAEGYARNYLLNIPAYTLIDAKIGIRTDRFDIGLYAQNLTNEYAVQYASASQGSEGYSLTAPRTIGVSLQAKF